MDLSKPLTIKNKEISFKEYCNTVKSEQASAINWLKTKDIKWNIPDSLRKKVDKSGRLKHYFGDTVAVPLKKEDIYSLETIQKKIYLEISDISAEELVSDCFHVTIHDLNSSSCKGEIQNKLENNKNKCKTIFKKLAEGLKKNPDQSKIKLNSTYIYPSCNISYVIGFVPDSEKDFKTLMNLYNNFNEVVYLDCLPRFHVTLNYFKPVELSGAKIIKMYNAFLKFNKQLDITIELDLLKLEYQRFENMNSYNSFLKLTR